MNRNLPFIMIGVLGIGIGILGVWLYQQQQPSGVDISISPSGVTIQER